MRGKEAIVLELKQLDKLSGLSSHTLPIKLSRTFSKLGSYIVTAKGREFFQFSLLLLDEELYSYDSFLDTVRHEFCHYYCRHYYTGNKIAPHGIEWKQACVQFGAVPRASETEASPELLKKKREYRKNCAKYIVTCPSCGAEVYYFRAGTIVKRMLRDQKHTAGYCGVCKFPLTGRDLAIPTQKKTE